MDLGLTAMQPGQQHVQSKIIDNNHKHTPTHILHKNTRTNSQNATETLCLLLHAELRPLTHAE
jgi:hypothetical protein